LPAPIRKPIDSLCGKIHCLESLLLFGAQPCFEIGERDLNGQYGAPARIETGLDGLQARDRRLRHRGRTMSLEVTCGFFEYLLQFAQRGALFLVRLNRVFDLIDRPTDDRQRDAA